jgi:hypothetical protein
MDALVVIPYTRPPVWPWPVAASMATRPRYVDVSGGEDTYWELLASLWADRQDVIVVEHDVTPDAEALDDLATCDRRWCAQPYPYLYGRANWGLACTKFTAAAMDAAPDLWAHVAVMSDHLHPPKHWCRLDAWSHRVLTSRGVNRHDHGLTVGHAHESTSHGCEVEHAAASAVPVAASGH